MSFTDFANARNLSSLMRRGFAADLQFRAGESFTPRPRREWDRLFAESTRVDRRRRPSR